MNARNGRGGPRAWRATGSTVAVIALGGAIGSLLRFQAGLVWPTPPGTFPTTILLVNLLGCLVIGVFLVVVTEAWSAHRLLRPFFATGVLGGFTTFSTYSLDIFALVQAGEPLEAMAYLLLTAIGAMLAVAAGMFATRRVIAARRSP